MYLILWEKWTLSGLAIKSLPQKQANNERGLIHTATQPSNVQLGGGAFETMQDGATMNIELMRFILNRESSCYSMPCHTETFGVCARKKGLLA